MTNKEFMSIIEENYDVYHPMQYTNLPINEFFKDIYFIMKDTKDENLLKTLNEIVNEYIILKRKINDYRLYFKDMPDELLYSIKEKASPIREKLDNQYVQNKSNRYASIKKEKEEKAQNFIDKLKGEKNNDK